MIEFNTDGSLKLPAKLARKKEENDNKLKSQRCIRIKREILSFTSPKKCVLRITLSDAFQDDRFVYTLFDEFRQRASVPAKMTKINDKEFEVEIGTDFKRCTDCNALINLYREFLCGNLIDEKGGCTFEGFKRSFSDEDYFE